MNIHYIVNKGKKKKILSTFYKIAQKFGHVHVFVGKHLLINQPQLINEMIMIAKKFNIKVTLNSELEAWETVFFEASDLFLEWVEQIDYIGIKYASGIEPQRIEPIADTIWQFNGNLSLYSLLEEMPENINDSFPSTFDRWVIYTKGLPFVSKQQHTKQVINDCPYVVDLEGNLASYDKKINGSVQLSQAKLIQLLADNHYKERITESISFPYTIKHREVQHTFYKITSGKAAFFDVEAVSRQLTNVAKYKQINDFPIPILYSLIIIEEGYLMVKERHSFSVTSIDNLQMIYHQFFKTLKQHNIQYLIVSGAALERRFLENMLYELREQLSLADYRYILSLRDHLIDIQHLLQEPHNSDKLLSEIRTFYPDLITFERKSEKLSIKISFILDGLIFGPKRDDKTLEKIIHYCFEDIYADFELFKFLSLYTRYRLK